MIDKLKSSKRTALLLLASIILIGFVARIWQINYGLPASYHMEEPIYTQASRQLICQGNLDSALLQPHTYLSAFSIGLGNLLSPGSLCQDSSDSESFAQSILLGRLVSVILGTATIAVVFKLGQLLYNTEIGLIGALFIALNFLHVRESQHGTPDITAVFVITAALLSYAYIADGKNSRFLYIIASILTVLSINARPTAVLLLLPFAYSHFRAHRVFQNWSWRTVLRAAVSRDVLLSGAVMVLVFVLINPQMWINPIGFLRFWRDFLSLGGQGGFGRLAVDPLPAPLFYLRAFEWGAALPLALVFALGCLWAFRRRTVGDILILSFALPYFLVASGSTVYFARYLIPILPFIGLLAARFLSEILPDARHSAWLSAAAVLLLVLPVTRILRYEYLQFQPDSRTLAAAWIENNIPDGAIIATEWHGPPLDEDRYQITVVDFYGLSEQDLEDYLREGYEYLIVSSFIRDTTMLSEDEEANKRAFYEELASRAERIQEFRPYSGTAAPSFYIDQVLGPITSLSEYERPGPTIEIYRLNQQ